MNQSTIFSIITAFIAFILLIAISFAYYKNSKERNNQIVGLLGILVVLFLLLTSIQIVFNVSNNAKIFLLLRFCLYLNFPFYLLQFFMFSILINRSNFSNNIIDWVKNSYVSRLLSISILLFFPIIVILDYLEIPFLNLTNFVLSNNINSVIQNSQKTFQTLGEGIFNNINNYLQIIIPTIIIILSIIFIIIDRKGKKHSNTLIHFIILAISSLSFFFINNNLYLLNKINSSSLDIILLIIIFIFSFSFSLVAWDIINDDLSTNFISIFKDISIKNKFSFIFSISSITLVFIAGIFVYNNVNSIDLNKFNLIGEEKTNSFITSLDNNVKEIYQEMYQLSLNFPEEEGEIQNYLSSLQTKHKDISLLAYIPLRGNTITATTLDESSIVLSNESWFPIVELSGNPYTGFISDENNLLNSGIEIVFPLHFGNSRFATGYFYGNILFRDMEFINSYNNINIFSEEDTPVYSTLSYLPSDVNQLSMKNASFGYDSNIPVSAEFNNQIYYLYDFSNELFKDTTSSLPINISYSENSSYSTQSSINLAIFTLLIIISIILIQLVLELIIKREVISPIEIIINSYKNKFKTKSFNLLSIKQKDELNSLSNILNEDYEFQLKINHEYEQRIEDLTFRLNRRATQLSAFTEIVSNATPSLEDINSMLTKYAQVISEQFNFYHVGIFLLDKNKEYAVLQSSNSPGGKRMLARGHRLEVGRVGCVGYAASTGRPRIAQDIGSDILYYANPDMPETMSEISIPMIENNSIIGVLDIQSKQKNAFLQDDIEILTSLASQIIFSIRNYETMSNAEKTLSELSELYGEKIKDAWNKHIEKQSVQYVYKQTGVADTAELILEDSLFDDPKRIQKNIKLRNQSIGKIQLKKDDSGWTDDEIQLIEDIIEQSAQALETARLAEQTRSRSSQIELLQNVTSTCASSLDEMSILDQVSDEILNELKLAHISFLLHDEQNNQINVVIDKSSTNHESSIIGQFINPIDSTIVMEVSNTRELRVLYHAKDYLLDPILNTILDNYQSSSTLILVPLTTRDISLGIMALVVDSDDNLIIDEQESTLLEQLASQITSALEISNLFDSELESRKATTALLDISRLASSSLAIGEVLSEVAQKTAVETNAYRCSILQINQNGDKFIPMLTRLASGASDLAYLRRLQDLFNNPIDQLPPLNNFNKGATSILLRLQDAPSNIQHNWMFPYEIKFILLVPIISQGQLVGAIALDSLENDQPFGNSQINLAEAISGILATTIENASLFERAIDRAEREHLVSDITTKLRTSNNPKEILQTAISELRQIYKPNNNDNIDTSKNNSSGESES